MQLGSQAGSEANTGERMSFVGIRIELDAQSIFSHGDDKLLVGAKACPFGRLQVNADKKVIVPAAERSRQVGVLNSIEKL